MKKSMKKHKKHMGQEGKKPHADEHPRSGRSAEELSLPADDKAKFADMNRPISRDGAVFCFHGCRFGPPAPMANSRGL